MRILIALSLLSIFLWSACTDVEKVEAGERLVDDETIVYSMSAFLSSQSIAENSFLLDTDLFIGDFDINDLSTICGSVIDTNFVMNVERKQIDISADIDFNMILECNNLNVPSSLSINSMSSGSFSSDNSSGTFEQSSHYDGQFDLFNLSLQLTGITGRTGMLEIDNGNELVTLLTSFNFELNELDYNLPTRSTLSGNATAIIGYSNEDIKEDYVINIIYLGNSLIRLEFNNKTFEIDLSN